MELKTAFAEALRETRARKGLTQEDFSTVSSRTNISLLERAGTIPTLEKLRQLCTILGVHPVTMMAICYSKMENVSVHSILARAAAEQAKLESDGRTQAERLETIRTP